MARGKGFFALLGSIFTPSTCDFCGCGIKRNFYRWNQKVACPNCNRRLENEQSRKAFDPSIADPIASDPPSASSSSNSCSCGTGCIKLLIVFLFMIIFGSISSSLREHPGAPLTSKSSSVPASTRSSDNKPAKPIPAEKLPEVKNDQTAEFQKAVDAYNQQLYAKAEMIYTRLAESGHVNAMYKLGCMYQDGVTGAANLPEARKWFVNAAAKGHVEAEKRLKELEKPLNIIPKSKPTHSSKSDNSFEVFVSELNKIDKTHAYFQHVALERKFYVITVTSRYFYEPYQNRLQLIQGVYKLLRGVTQDSSPLLKIVDQMGNEVGGNEMFGGVWVQK